MKLIPMQFLKGAFFSALSAVVIGFAGYLTRRFMANNLPENEYALFYSTFSLISYFSILTQFGLSDVVLYKLPGLYSRGEPMEAAGTYKFVRRFQLLGSTVVFIQLCCFIPLLKKHYYDFPVSVAHLLVFFVLIWAFTLENTVMAALNSVKKFGALSLLQALKNVFFCLAVVICLYCVNFTWILVSYAAIVTICSFIGDRLFSKTMPEKCVRMQCPKVHLLTSGGFYILLQMGNHIFLDFGNMALGFFSTAKSEQISLFNIALSIAMIVHSFSAVLSIFMPMIADSYAQHEKERMRKVFFLLFLLTGIAMVSAFFVFHFFGDFIISLLFEEKFIAAKVSTIIMTESAILYMPVSAFSNFFNTVGQQKTSVIALIPTIGITLFVFPILQRKFGAAGASAATLISMVTWLIVYAAFYRKFMKNW